MTRNARLRPALSPCVGVCRMDEASGLCLGCGRTLAEIAGWGVMEDDPRARIMQALPARLEALRSRKSETPRTGR